MSLSPTDPLPSSLREVLDAEIVVIGKLKDPNVQRDLEAAMRQLAGVDEFIASHDRLLVRYQPVIITKAQLIENLRKRGFEVESAGLASTSPASDAFEEALFGEGKPEVTPLPSDLA